MTKVWYSFHRLLSICERTIFFPLNLKIVIFLMRKRDFLAIITLISNMYKKQANKGRI